MAERAATSLLQQVRRLVLAELAGLPVRVFLFGSWARGEARPDSDVDVAVRPMAPLPWGRSLWPTGKFGRARGIGSAASCVARPHPAAPPRCCCRSTARARVSLA